MRYASYLSILILGATPASADVWGCPDTDNNGVPLQNSVLIVGGRTMQCYYGVAAMAGPEVCTYDLTDGNLQDGDSLCPVLDKQFTGTQSPTPSASSPPPRASAHVPPSSSVTTPAATSALVNTFHTSQDVSQDGTPTGSSSGATRTTAAAETFSTTAKQSSSVLIPESALTGGSVATSPGSATSISSGASSPGPSSGGEAPPAPVNGEHGASTPASKIAGITVGIAALVGLLIALLVYIRRRYTPIRALLHPKFHLELSTQRSILPVAVPEKDQAATSRRRRTVERDTASTISSQAAEIRQEYLRNRIRAAQRELDAILADSPLHSDAERSGENEETTLEEASQGNEAFRERISVLESQLQSQWALGLSDEPPPGYLE